MGECVKYLYTGSWDLEGLLMKMRSRRATIGRVQDYRISKSHIARDYIKYVVEVLLLPVLKNPSNLCRIKVLC
jgi:hypothetical protein